MRTINGREPQLITVKGEWRKDTQKAHMVYFGDNMAGREVWVALPMSLTENHNDGTFTIPVWLAEEKGIENAGE